MLYVQFEDEVLELNYDENLVIQLNGKNMPLESEERYYYGKLIDYMVFSTGFSYSNVLVHLKNIDLTLYYNLEGVRMIMPYRTSHGGECNITNVNEL